MLPRSGTNEQRGLLEALVEVKSVPVRFYNTHLKHTGAEERALQVRAIMEHTEGVEEPQILVGDLSAEPRSSRRSTIATWTRGPWAARAPATP